MEGVRFRAATAADKGVLTAFVLELQALEREPLGAPGEDQAAAARRMLDECRGFVAEFEGRVVGGALLLMVDGARAGERSAFVMMIAVDAGHRRRGFGRRFLCWLEGEARSLGARRLSLNVRSGNVAARALYAGSGFSVVSEVMAKPLGP